MKLHQTESGFSMLEKASKVYRHSFNGIYKIVKNRNDNDSVGKFVTEETILKSLNEEHVVIVDKEGNYLASSV
ncbi:hypothetical protein WKH57_01695 [Niallia taxi]|uniref:hypothetical protein n=1 Tax=Niallia taxi TaxID=2499688 RepID=UPI00316BCE80